MSLLLALFAQVGPFVTPGPQTVSPLPPELEEREAPGRTGEDAEPPKSDLERCLVDSKSDTKRAVALAEKWFGKAQGVAKAQAGHCLGVTLARMELWDEAAAAFIAARDALVGEDLAYRARLGAMAGNALLAEGQVQTALDALDGAHGDAQTAGHGDMAGSIAMDRARALVALGRENEAEAALTEAREALPGDAQAWLLSATLSRRMDKLAEAQAQIEKAAEMLPVDPEIGLEAGRIAMLSGREEAARKSWQSVVDAAPDSEAAKKAQTYLEQLDSR
ncbi:MAG: tetratricopeptide repeat protein [Novosphingobium sp.]